MYILLCLSDLALSQSLYFFRIGAVSQSGTCYHMTQEGEVSNFCILMIFSTTNHCCIFKCKQITTKDCPCVFGHFTLKVKKGLNLGSII